MISLTSLLFSILVSAVAVFIVSSILHMMLPYHKSDMKKLADEEGVMNALRPFNIEPGDYSFPQPSSMKEMAEEGYQKKIQEGPVAFVTFLENKVPSMGKSLLQWFLYSILVSVFSAYIARITLNPETSSQMVMRVTSAVAFSGYSLALLQHSIWYKRNWITTLKSMFDGLIYALVTGAVFLWLWP